MNAGVPVPSFIADLTGITNAMVQSAPAARQVMDELCKFLGPLPLVAHKASFDKKFFENECRLAGISHESQFACSMLVSRRLFPEVSNYKLETLVNHLKIPNTGKFHRALSDAEMTAKLVLVIHQKIFEDYGISYPSHDMLTKLQQTKYAEVRKVLENFGTSPSSKRCAAKPKVRSAKKKTKTKPKTDRKSEKPAAKPSAERSTTKTTSNTKINSTNKTATTRHANSKLTIETSGSNETPQNNAGAFLEAQRVSYHTAALQNSQKQKKGWPSWVWGLLIFNGLILIAKLAGALK